MNRYSRAQRRHDRARLKKNRRNHWGYGKQGWRTYCEHERGSLHEMPVATAGMVVDTPTPCSCYMCGNPRRNSWAHGMDRLTIQEQKAAADFKDQIGDYYWDEWDYDDSDYYMDYYLDEDTFMNWYLKGLYFK